jgi:uncharacterized membrane protein HdeD (DUF308 family)
MDPVVLRSWWVYVLRGVVALAIGLAALAWPGLTMLGLVGLFAAFALLGGAASVAGALQERRREEYWWLVLLIGLVGIGAGVIAVLHPQLTALVLVLIIAANAIVTGVLEISLAVRLRREISGEWLLGLVGLLSIAFGVLVFLFPTAGVLAMIWLFSFYATVTGALLIALGWRVRSLSRGIHRAHVSRGPDRRNGLPA